MNQGSNKRMGTFDKENQLSNHLKQSAEGINSNCYNSVPNISPFQSNGQDKLQGNTIAKPPE
jgi:hypothetical protein